MMHEATANFPPDLPRARSAAPFIEDPLLAFQHGRRQWGDVFVIAEDSPLFSGADDCTGCVAAFGEANMRRVLNHLEEFGMPVPLARQHELPPTLARLNSGLFSMTGAEHRMHQRLLASVLNARAVDTQAHRILEACSAFMASWASGQIVPLLTEMRRLALHISCRVILGGDSAEVMALGESVQAYFGMRRDYTTASHPSSNQREHLVELGHCLDGDLRRHIRRLQSGGENPDSVLAQLCRVKTSEGEKLDEQQLITHANVLFMSSSEPFAVTMTWMLLLLTQSPDLRAELRNIIATGRALDSVSDPRNRRASVLLDGVIKETLRLFPPNAVMIRLTRCTTDIGGFRLPNRCEVLLSPYLSHRDPACFPEPDRFLPSRWERLSPGVFEYLPFGNGQRYCMGRNLAASSLAIALTAILGRFDCVLAEDQEIDWNINVNLMPTSDPAMRIDSRQQRQGGRLTGPVSQLVHLPPFDDVCSSRTPS
jgi:cytochrome P450